MTANDIDASDDDHFTDSDFVMVRDPVLWWWFESLPLFDASPWLDWAASNSPDTELDPAAYTPSEPAIVRRTCGATTESDR